MLKQRPAVGNAEVNRHRLTRRRLASRLQRVEQIVGECNRGQQGSGARVAGVQRLQSRVHPLKGHIVIAIGDGQALQQVVELLATHSGLQLPRKPHVACLTRVGCGNDGEGSVVPAVLHSGY